MRTRRGACYSCHEEGPEMHLRKRRRTEGSPSAVSGPAWCAGGVGDMFEELPDDLVVSILADVAASAGSPADLAGAIMTYVSAYSVCFLDIVVRSQEPRNRRRWYGGVLIRMCVQVQEIQGVGAKQGGSCQGVAAVPRRPCPKLVGVCAPVSAALRGRRQPRRLLPSWHDPVLLPREPRVGRGADGGGGGWWAPGGPLLAGRHPVQRQRRHQGRPRPPRGRRAVRARGVARPRRRAPRARALPAGRLRRAPLAARRAPPPHPGQRAGTRRRGHRVGLAAPLHRPQRQGLPATLVPAQRLRVPRRGRSGRRRGALRQPFPVRVVRVPAARRREQQHPRAGAGGGGWLRRWTAPLLPRAVRAARDAAARVPSVLRVRRGELLLARVPGAALEDGAQGGVHAHGPVARRRQRQPRPQCRRRARRRRGRRAGSVTL